LGLENGEVGTWSRAGGDFQLEWAFALSRRSAAPRRGVDSPPGQELLGVISSHGPSRESYRPSLENQEGRRRRLACRPRMRRCLLKGCEQSFHPRQARQRYCGQRCREGARKRSRRKAQERYRETATGSKNGTGKAGATASASRAGNHQSQRQLTALRG
jgi:hypothetical protein